MTQSINNSFSNKILIKHYNMKRTSQKNSGTSYFVSICGYY